MTPEFKVITASIEQGAYVIGVKRPNCEEVNFYPPEVWISGMVDQFSELGEPEDMMPIYDAAASALLDL